MQGTGKPTLKRRILAGALAGIPGGIAHALVNEIDRVVFNYDTDDMLMVTGTFMDERGPARKLGFFMHLGFAMAFGIGYAVVLNPRDEKDAVVRGVGAGLVENSILWPLVGPLDKHHPYIRSGRIDRFHHPIALVQANLRHIALGYAIGKSYPAILHRLKGESDPVALDVR